MYFPVPPRACNFVGYEVIRFHHEDDWLAIVRRYRHVFGEPG